MRKFRQFLAWWKFQFDAERFISLDCRDGNHGDCVSCACQHHNSRIKLNDRY